MAGRCPRHSERAERDNYSSTNEYEYFAQAVNAYLGVNEGTDRYTGRPRNNRARYVRDHEPALLPIMERLFGAEPESTELGVANPVSATEAENETWAGFRALWDQAEGVHKPQSHTLAPADPVLPDPAVETAQEPTQEPAQDGRTPATRSPRPRRPRAAASRAGEPGRLRLGLRRQLGFRLRGRDRGRNRAPRLGARVVAGHDVRPQRTAVPRDRLLETSEALYGLVRESAGRDTTGAGMGRGLDRLTRYVLHMGSAQPGTVDYRLVGALALDASSDDLADVDLLAQYFIERQIETGGARSARARCCATARTPSDATSADPGRHPVLDSYGVRSGDGCFRARALDEPVPGHGQGGQRLRRGGPPGPHLPRGQRRGAGHADLVRPAAARGADIVLALPRSTGGWWRTWSPGRRGVASGTPTRRSAWSRTPRRGRTTWCWTRPRTPPAPRAGPRSTRRTAAWSAPVTSAARATATATTPSPPAATGTRTSTAGSRRRSAPGRSRRAAPSR
ncbi:hypothetical protein NKH77_28645 [Streptomyces sp. M19]